MAEDAAAALAKIKALIDRAVHPTTPIEEARTSALVALRLMRSSGVECVSAVELRELRARPTSAGSTSASNGERTASSSAQEREWAKHRRRREEAGGERARDPEDGYVLIVSAYNGWCKACRRGYQEGDEIAWRKGKGATHYECRSYWDETAA